MITATDTLRGTAPPDTGRPTGGERRCLATRAVLPKADLVRFVIDPDGVVTPDVAGRLPGRGLWVAARRQALARAVDKRLFGRAARRSVVVPDGLLDRLDMLLVRRCCDLIGLARRAGLAVAGFEKVRERLRRGDAALLLAAADGAADGRGKLRALAPALPVCDTLDTAQLGAAFGRGRAVHAVLTAGGITDRLRLELARLDGIRGDGPAMPGTGEDDNNGRGAPSVDAALKRVH